LHENCKPDHFPCSLHIIVLDEWPSSVLNPSRHFTFAEYWYEKVPFPWSIPVALESGGMEGAPQKTSKNVILFP